MSNQPKYEFVSVRTTISWVCMLDKMRGMLYAIMPSSHWTRPLHGFHHVAPPSHRSLGVTHGKCLFVKLHGSLTFSPSHSALEYHWEVFDGARVASWRLLLKWLRWCWKVGPWGKAKEWNAGGFPIKGPPLGMNQTHEKEVLGMLESSKGSQEIDVCSNPRTLRLSHQKATTKLILP